MHRLSKYRPTGYDKNAGFIIVLLALLFFGAMYAILTRVDNGYAGFIMLIAASGFIAYWTMHLRRVFRVEEAKPVMHKMEQHKDWVYDLIRGENEIIFVAEVPGPEEEVNARLVNGTLYINGGQNFNKSIPLDVNEDMGIAEFRYRNGILTLKIKRLM